MKLLRLLAVVGLALAGTTVSPAWACGCGGYVPDAASQARVYGENALVRFDGRTEQIHLSMAVNGRSRTAAWIMPVPSAATVELGRESLFAELDQRFGDGFDPGVTRPADAADLSEPRGLFLVARLRDDPIGCVGLKLHGREPAEVKRMWVDRGTRGLGVGRRLLLALEKEAAARRMRLLRLETNRSLHEARALYRRNGYREVPAFNDEPYADHWFEKRTGPSGG